MSAHVEHSQLHYTPSQQLLSVHMYAQAQESRDRASDVVSRLRPAVRAYSQFVARSVANSAHIGIVS